MPLWRTSSSRLRLVTPSHGKRSEGGKDPLEVINGFSEFALRPGNG